jgi:3-oxoacyl-[acyl-carrier-protein] synthase I
MSIKITAYNAICNIGNDIDEIFFNAIKGFSDKFAIKNDIIKGVNLRLGLVDKILPEISAPEFDLRCNRLLLACCELLQTKIEKLIKTYGRENIAIIVATTNSGVEEFEISNNKEHCQIGNPAIFLKKYFGLNNFSASVSTACSSGIKAFSLAKNLLMSDTSSAAIVFGVDSIAKVPLFGFNSLEVLTSNPTNPFSKNRSGINIGEGVAAFIVEKDVKQGIDILGIGETTDTYHLTTPNPDGKEAAKTIQLALKDAKLNSGDVDYINLHGTGTFANDKMEANAIFNVFGTQTPASSTKPLTGHCLGASAAIECAMCCKLLENNNKKIYPHIFDGEYDKDLPKINLVKKNQSLIRLKTILCTSFGFGGTNAAIILRREI